MPWKLLFLTGGKGLKINAKWTKNLHNKEVLLHEKKPTSKKRKNIIKGIFTLHFIF